MLIDFLKLLLNQQELDFLKKNFDKENTIRLLKEKDN